MKFALLLLVIAAQAAFADGGAVLLTKEAGPYVLTLFGSPTPLRAGRVDLSVLVQTASDKANVLNAKVALHLAKTDAGSIVEFTIPATHDAATNKLLYAASLNVPSAGDWRVRVDVKASAGEASVGTAIPVLQSEPPILTYWPYFLAVPVIAILFGLNQWLKRRRSLSRQRGLA